MSNRHHPHINNISVFDADRVVIKPDHDGGSKALRITIYGENEHAPTIITVWRGSGDEAVSPQVTIVGESNDAAD